jgi:hypothetical protein
MVSLSIAANPASVPRTGTVTIAGLAFIVTQAGVSCTYTVRTGPLRFNANGVSATIWVFAPSGCAWTATSQVAWMTITSGTSGSGDGAVTFQAAASTGPPRSGTLTVAGWTITVTEGPRGRLGLAHPVVPRHSPTAAQARFRPPN